MLFNLASSVDETELHVTASSASTTCDKSDFGHCQPMFSALPAVDRRQQQICVHSSSKQSGLEGPLLWPSELHRRVAVGRR